jgi:site-specific DNA-methyltransferase (adenine-specific)
VTAPYFADGQVQLYLGDCREVLPALGVTADCVIADPPYASTAHEWDRWPDEWPQAAAAVSRSMWCFGTLRLLMGHAGEFIDAGWKLSHDVIWEKPNGTSFATDRFRGVHETIGHFYRGDWGAVRHEVPKTEAAWRTAPNSGRAQPPHTGTIGSQAWSDDGTRLARSVQKVPDMWRRKPIQGSQKPLRLLEMLLAYACPPGGLVVDPMAGSGSVLEIARQTARRLSQGVLAMEGP